MFVHKNLHINWRIVCIRLAFPGLRMYIIESQTWNCQVSKSNIKNESFTSFLSPFKGAQSRGVWRLVLYCVIWPGYLGSGMTLVYIVLP